MYTLCTVYYYPGGSANKQTLYDVCAITTADDGDDDAARPPSRRQNCCVRFERTARTVCTPLKTLLLRLDIYPRYTHTIRIKIRLSFVMIIIAVRVSSMAIIIIRK